MSDQVTDLRSTVATLRRRKRVLAATAVLGLVVGAVYVIVQPPQLTSTSLVLLPEQIEGQSTGPDVDTQVRIASSATILEGAGAVLEPALPAESVLEMVEVTASTTQIVKIDASSTLASQAQGLSQAVAESFVAYVNYTQDPRDEGGWGIGHIGPIPEGLAAWLVAAIALVGVARLIGRRTGKEDS